MRMIWVLAPTASVAVAQETPPSREAPAVPSFERFAEADPAEGGRLLLGELGCVSCHPSDGSDFLPVRRGPILADAGRKFRSEWLRAWLESPSRVKPGTTMPAAAREPAEIDPLVHYLLSLRSEPPAAEAAGTPAKARDIYEQTGCAACHGPLEGKDLAGPFVPLGDLRSKYRSAGALAQFLQDPLRARPSGRMPRLNLSAAEAGALALYFVGSRPRDPDDPGGTRPGVAFEYFEGSWGKLPDFDALKPAASGVSAGFDLKPLRRRDHVGLRFRGYVEVPRDGLYTFTTTSDDGSRLRIGSAVVVDNDGTHPAVEAAGTIALRKGKHALTVEWFEAGGEESLAVHWEGPGIAKEPIPLSALSHVPPSGLGPVREKPPEEGIRPDPALCDGVAKSSSGAACPAMKPSRGIGRFRRSLWRRCEGSPADVWRSDRPERPPSTRCRSASAPLSGRRWTLRPQQARGRWKAA
ncbi:MAG: PA14 domain-containing protein [Planctomycetota bacterium]